MKYIRCDWIHSSSEDPVVLYSELDDDRWETRKVEIYADGRCGSASQSESFGGAQLGLEPTPSFEEINSDPQFRLVEIEKREFEEIWSRRLQPGHTF
jgi:hypothetical protein